MRSHYKFWAVETLKINQCPQYLMQTIWYKEVKQLVWRDWVIGSSYRKRQRTSSSQSHALPAKVKVAQLCLTLCDPMDYTVHGILQARILEWVAFPFSRGYSQPRDQTHVFCIEGRFFISWTTEGSPRILEWVVYPFSSRSSKPRNWTRVSCIAGGFFTNWVIKEAQIALPFPGGSSLETTLLFSHLHKSNLLNVQSFLQSFN